jgi:hypothetical protein
MVFLVLFESVFMVRGGSFGEDFSLKLIISIVSFLVCVYDWKKNERYDYFWVFLTGSIIWTCAETILQLLGTRLIQQKYIFGIDITDQLWITIPLQGISEGAAIAIMGLFFGDLILNPETRKKGLIIFAFLLSLLLINFYRGINFENVDVGGNVPSRRNIFTPLSLIYLFLLILPAIYWLIKTNPESRKRATSMYLVMVIFATIWTLIEWLTGQRWIEMGIQNPDGTYSNLRRAPPIVEFLALGYDVVIEIALAYVPFLAIPYLLRLIKTNKKEKTLKNQI